VRSEECKDDSSEDGCDETADATDSPEEDDRS